MLHRATPQLCLLVFAAVSCVHAADPLDAVFPHIDAASKSFKGMTADVTNTSHSALVDSDDVEAGNIKLLRAKDGTHLLMTLKTRTASVDPREIKLYTPKTKTVDVFNLANKQSELNQFLLLGFGASSADLKASYDVSWIGDENVGGQPTAHLKFIPKAPETRRSLKQADLWYGANGLVVQQKFLQPSGDYRLVLYSGMKLNAPSEKDVQLTLSKDVTVQKH